MKATFNYTKEQIEKAEMMVQRAFLGDAKKAYEYLMAEYKNDDPSVLDLF